MDSAAPALTVASRNTEVLVDSHHQYEAQVRVCGLLCSYLDPFYPVVRARGLLLSHENGRNEDSSPHLARMTLERR